MAETDIILNVKVDSEDSVNELEAVEKQFEKIDQVAEETGETIAAMTKKMELYKSAALKAGATSPIGKKAIQNAAQLQGELDKVNELVNRNNQDFDKFRSVVGISSTAISSYAAFQGVSALVGIENENLIQTMVKLQAAQQVLNSLEQVRIGLLQKNSVATKGLAAIQKAYTFAVGTSTAGMKAFRLALISTGIGALVVGLGLLIANFGKVSAWVQKMIKRFDFLRLAVEPLIWIFNKIKEGLQELGIIDDEQTVKALANAEARVESLKKEEKAIGEKYDFEIAKAKAAGENTFLLEQEKRKALIERIRAEAKAIVQLAKLNGEFTDEQRERAEELAETFKKIAQDSVVARISEEKKVTDNYKKEIDKRAALGEKEAQEKQRLLDEEIERQDLQFQLMNELTLSAQDLEIQNLIKGYEDKFALAEGNNELEKQLEIQQKEDLLAINEEFANRKLQAESDKAFALMELRLELKELGAGELSDNASPEEVREYYEQRNEIEEEQFELESERLRGELETGAITKEEFSLKGQIIEKINSKNIKKIKEEEAAFEKKLNDQKVGAAIGAASSILSSVSQIAAEGSNIGKAAAVGQATMDTYKSAVAAYAAGSSVGGPAGLVLGPLAAGLAVTAGILNVKKIVSTKTPGGGGGGGASLPTAPSASSFSAVTSSSPDVDTGVTTGTDGLLGEGGGVPEPPVVKVEVLESDIKKATDSNNESASISQL